jgi:hypothetical protein
VVNRTVTVNLQREKRKNAEWGFEPQRHRGHRGCLRHGKLLNAEALRGISNHRGTKTQRMP